MVNMFSVVIPLYNKRKSVRRAVNSVLDQTYSHFELIIINDGSTDNSLNELENIIDSRIRIITQKNQGVSSARNRGVLEAQYKWVAFLDADDEWLPDFLSIIYDLQINYPVSGLLSTGFLRNRLNGFDYEEFRKSKYAEGWRGIIEDYYVDLLEGAPFCSSSFVVNKHILLQAGGFPVGMIVGEDIDTWIRLYELTSFAYYKHIGAIYHLGAENRSNKPLVKVFSNPKDYTIGDLLRKIIKSNSIPKLKRMPIIELLAKFDIPIIRKLIQNGYRWDALKRLWWLRRTKVYRRKSIKLLITCVLPKKLSEYLGLVAGQS